MSSTNAAQVLLAAGSAGHAALVCGDDTLSHAELRGQVARTAALWRARGLQPGARIAIKLPDGFDWVIAFLGTLWAGMVAVPVNPRVPAAEWQAMLDEAGFSLILVDGSDDVPAPWSTRTLQIGALQRELLSPTLVPVDACPVDADAAAFWCHSSGTSGKPKAVMHAHRFADRIEQVSREGLGIRGDDRCV